MNDVKSFSFYRSYYEGLKEIDENDRKEIINAMIEFVFCDKIPDFSGTKKTIWILIEPNLNVSKKRANTSQGAPIGNQNALKNKEETEQKEKQSKNNQKTINAIIDNHMNSLSISSSISYSNSNIKDNIMLNSLFIEYLELRKKNKLSISETVIKELLEDLDKYGRNDKDKEKIIKNSITKNWKGFFPLDEKDKVDKKEKRIL